MEENNFHLVTFDDLECARSLFGEHDQNLRFVEELLDVRVSARGSEVKLWGAKEDRDLALKLLCGLYELVKNGHPVYRMDVGFASRILKQDANTDLKDIFLDAVYISTEKKLVAPKSLAQKEYVDAIRQHDIVLGIGPAGTGKTYLAMAMAVSFLTRKQVSRIILTRPALEAGEKLGFLPGDIQEKVNPYLRPLYDALHDMMDLERASRLLERGVVEVAPLAFMRGRTLNDSFVILDEAQNTTFEQMKMFLTRLGFGSKAVITGDITQIDLPASRPSGLVDVIQILKDVEGIKFVYFSELDVVRHSLVQDIIKAYEKNEVRAAAAVSHEDDE
ncbi:MAG: PhoH family protein [Thermodesulfobacteriota bacterium]